MWTATQRRRSGPAVLAAAVLAAMLVACMGPSPVSALLMAAGLGLITLQIAWQDWTEFLISDAAVLALALLGATSRVTEAGLIGDAPGEALGLAALHGLICAGAFLGLREVYYRRRGYDGIGFGDVKLAAAGGILVGASAFTWSVLAASLTGLAIALWVRSRPLPTDCAGLAGDKIAFGALLAPALWLAWILTLSW